MCKLYFVLNRLGTRVFSSRTPSLSSSTSFALLQCTSTFAPPHRCSYFGSRGRAPSHSTFSGVPPQNPYRTRVHRDTARGITSSEQSLPNHILSPPCVALRTTVHKDIRRKDRGPGNSCELKLSPDSPIFFTTKYPFGFTRFPCTHTSYHWPPGVTVIK